MILKAKHHFIIHPFFKRYTVWKMKKEFASVSIIGDDVTIDDSVLVLANHISWWDGFWMMYLNLKRIHKKFHFMMLEDQLRKHWFFNYTGGYSIKPGSRSVIESLSYTKELLAQVGNLVLIFPTGEIQSMHQQKHAFQNGINQLISTGAARFNVLLVACFTDYFSSPKPHLNIYIKSLSVSDLSTRSSEELYNGFYEECRQLQCSKETLMRSESAQ